MKVFVRILMKMLLVVLFVMASIKVYSQVNRQIDASRLVEIDNPPLTAREGKGLNIPLPPPEHPRLFLRKTDIPAIKAKMNHHLLKECCDKIYKSAGYETDGKLIQENTEYNLDNRVLNAIEARAFMYALNGDRTKGNEAVDMVFNLNNTVILERANHDLFRSIGRVILTTAIVYDWCYDLISEGEKKSLIAVMESLGTRMEIKWPYLVQNSVTGHGVEEQISRDMLSCGIAVYDEKPEIYKRVAGRIFAEIIPARNFNYQSGHHHQGSAYGPFRFIREIYTTLIFDRMGYPNITDKLQGKIPYYWLYSRRPDGQLFRDGDVGTEQIPSGKYWDLPPILYAASYYNDPVLMGEAVKEKLIGRDPLFDLLLTAPDVPAEDISSLPLTRYFPSPFGGMVARTNWNEGPDADAVVAEMKIAEYNFVNHQHLDAGSFQIYYKGPLAVESGIYYGTEGRYGCEHFTHYYQRTIAHNCLLVYNPEEKFLRGKQILNNDGGQRLPALGKEPATLDAVLNDGYKTADVQAHAFGPDSVKPEYSYLKGDITQAYTDKVKSHKRSFVFLNLNRSDIPAVLVVFDHVTVSDKNFKKTWLLHSVQEPMFKGNTCEIVRNKKGYNGKLVNTTLFPLAENLHLTKVGGEGNEYSVNGINYPQRFVQEDNSGEGTAWRTEISPKKSTETDIFLNVMQVMDSNGKVQPLFVDRVETDRFVGANIGDRIVLFSKAGKEETGSIQLKIKGKGMFKVLVSDLAKGVWNISSSGKKYNFTNTVKDDNHLIYFEVSAGEYSITRE